MSKWKTIIDGPTTCPNDPNFEHDNYYGCVPKDFSIATGRSRKYAQKLHGDRYYWGGGCAALRLAAALGKETT